ncbi:MAG: hypothetical protein Q4F83_15535 [Eubacteriales bacterium]|nr:hypothetical protein [Eubacteriales bacterium]
MEVYAKSTIKKLLKTALEPVGTTMYVWGGGWGKIAASSKYTTRIGVSPAWKKFYKKQKKNYDYTKTRFQIADGLDCSGYAGWCIYNIMNTVSGKRGYVMPAKNMAYNYAKRGWGEYTEMSKVKNFRAGDIMSSSGHVYIVVGQCGDGSVVLLHSSPPGVQISGTETPSGNRNSQAGKLANQYMKKYFPKWYKEFGNDIKDRTYLTEYNRMRWDISGKSVMFDPDGYRNKTAEQILEDIFK